MKKILFLSLLVSTMTVQSNWKKFGKNVRKVTPLFYALNGYIGSRTDSQFKSLASWGGTGAIFADAFSWPVNKNLKNKIIVLRLGKVAIKSSSFLMIGVLLKDAVETTRDIIKN